MSEEANFDIPEDESGIDIEVDSTDTQNLKKTHEDFGAWNNWRNKAREGKSIIICALTTFLALMGKKVDIVISTINLAKRDADEL